MSNPFCTIPEAIAEVQAGRLVVLVDDEHRENEGDLFCAAEKLTPEKVNFMLRYGRGVLCLSLSRERCQQLNLPPQVSENTSRFGTAFCAKIDAHARFGVTTGVSARDRCTTVLRAVADDARPDDFTRPGHIDTLMARDGGVLVRAGQTEGTVDLARLAGLKPAGVLIEVMKDDGEMARVPDLVPFCKKHGLKMCTVADLIEYRMNRENLVERVGSLSLPTRYGRFTLIEYRSLVEHDPHLALCCGGVGELGPEGRPVVHPEPVLVRVHSECLTGDVFGSLRCDCGGQLGRALEMIQAAGKGVLVYLRQEGRGIGLHNKLAAYRLQDQGLDTVEANERLGFPADKRDYGIGAQILRDLGLRKLRILTNNPKKISRLEIYGLQIVEQLAIQITPTDENRRYLRTKRSKLGHTLSDL